MDKLLAQLKVIVGENNFISPDIMQQQATSYWNNQPKQGLCQLNPTTTEQVSQIVKLCHQHNQPIVTHGGLTGCVQGADSRAEEVVVSLQKLNRILDIDSVGGTVTVESGVILEVLQQRMIESQLMFPVDLGARGSCTIGGNISTNAGGINVLRYGMMRNQVLGLEVVQADGSVLNLMNQMLKNNTAYDLKQLFIGSEGTLGIVTKAVLKLVPYLKDSQCAMVALDDFDSVTDLLKMAQAKLHGSLSAFEVMWGDYYDAVTVPGCHRPVLERNHAYYVLLETHHNNNSAADIAFESLLEQAFEDNKIIDAAIPKSIKERQLMWDIRENFESIVENKPVYMYDISLPIRMMKGYIEQLKLALKSAWPESRCYTFGHIADGNLHLFIHPNDELASHEHCNRLVYGPLQTFEGAISAEHGIGTEKQAALAQFGDPTALALMKTLKQTLDPHNILNPGRVLP